MRRPDAAESVFGVMTAALRDLLDTDTTYRPLETQS